MNKAEQKQVGRLYVDLKEHFDKLWQERKENITLQFAANTARLDATASVLEHRLEVLNHAHDQSIQDRADFVKEPEYRAKIKELDNWHVEMGTRLTQSETRSKTWTFAIGAVFTIMQIVIGLLLYLKK